MTRSPSHFGRSSDSPRRRGNARSQVGAAALLVAMPPFAVALGVATMDSGHALVTDIARAPSLGLATPTIAEVLAVVAGAAGTGICAYLSLATLLLLLTPRRSRVHAAAARVTPVAWRRVVSLAAAGALSAGLALPASASPEASDAGWVPEPVTPRTESPTQNPPAVPASAQRIDASEHHVVLEGESLWSITADSLVGVRGDHFASSDAAAIAALWPALYDANRDTVGEDPGLIHPGQRLVIPAEWSR